MGVYVGQKKLRQLHQPVDDCCKLELEMLDNLHYRDNKTLNPYWETIRKIHNSDFITWLTKQENFKKAKKILFEKNIQNDSDLNNDFFASFEHLCLIMLRFMTDIARNENQIFFLKKRQTELRKAVRHLQYATKITYPTSCISDEFIKAKEQLEKEIDSSLDANYRDKPNLLRTLMADSFIDDLLILYKSKINFITPTIITDIAICILNLVFDHEITKEYLMKKSSATLIQHKLKTSQECT